MSPGHQRTTRTHTRAPSLPGDRPAAGGGQLRALPRDDEAGAREDVRGPRTGQEGAERAYHPYGLLIWDALR
jgi:hypothetical protein